jgi:hypothetical protein
VKYKCCVCVGSTFLRVQAQGVTELVNVVRVVPAALEEQTARMCSNKLDKVRLRRADIRQMKVVGS